MSLPAKIREQQVLESVGGLGPLTIDDFLGGKVRLIQLEKGYRAGMDAVLLAASIDAHPRERALDLGTGTGAVAICLAARCKGVAVEGLEIQENLARLADANVTLNDLGERVKIHSGSVAGNPKGIPDDCYHHVFANPPYLEGTQAIPPPEASKGIAHIGGEAELGDWVRFALRKVKNKGTLTFIFRADRITELFHHLHGKAGEIVVFPLWPREGEPAKRVIVRARKGLFGGTTMAPGMELHGTLERYSKAAEGVLRRGEAIDLARFNRAKGP